MGDILILLAQREIKTTPDLYSTRLQVEENVGEDIHVHFRNHRLEFKRDEFIEYAEAMAEALNRLKDRG